MNPFFKIKVRDYIYRKLDNAIWLCPEDNRLWYLTASYADCRQLFISKVWSEEDVPPYDGFYITDDKIRESDLEDIESLFENVKRDVLKNEYDVQYEMTLLGCHVIFFYDGNPLKIEINGTRICIDMDLNRFRYRLANKDEWITPEYTIRIDDKKPYRK